MITYALDTETDYSKDYSVADMDVWHYVNDPRFNCYMLTICGDNGFEYAGKPEDFDWSLLDGATVVSHNRSFDKHVVDRLVELGKVPAFQPAAWWCSADCASYHGLPRSLAGVCEHLFNIKPDKSVRDKMRGKDAAALSAADGLELIHYAIEDARLCLKVWQTLSPIWPEHERWLSAHTGDIGVRGLPVDIEGLDKGIRHLGEIQVRAELAIPWADEAPPLSPKKLAEECRKAGILPPSSLAKDSEECQAWEDQYGDQFPWVGAMRDYRRSNTLKAKLETMRARVRPDTGRSCFSLKYFGATTTGRWSGGGGWNVQNLGKGEILGVDMRSLIKAPPGKTFVVVDLSQIEPRCCRAGTLVKTDSGYKHIEELTQIDKIYDGVVWCRHDGVIEKRNKECLPLNGEWFTGDHRVLCEEGWKEVATLGDQRGQDGAWAERKANWEDLRKLVGFVGAFTIRVSLQVLRKMLGVRRRSQSVHGGHETGEIAPVSGMWQEIHDQNKVSGAVREGAGPAGPSPDGTPEVHHPALHQPEPPELRSLRGTRDSDGAGVCRQPKSVVRLPKVPAERITTPNH